MEKDKLHRQYYEINQYLAKKLKESRVQHEPYLSQERLAEGIGINRSTLAGYENCQTIAPWWIVCIYSKYFEKDLSYYSYLDNLEKEEDNIESISQKNT